MRVLAVCLLLLAASAATLGAPVRSDGVESIAAAAARGDMESVRERARAHVDVNAPAEDGTAALHWVVYRQELDTARALLRAGADVNRPNRYGVRPLLLAISNDDVAMVRLLLKSGAEPNSADATGMTALMLAAGRGDPALVTSLLDKGAAVDARDPEYQQTALMFAARGGYAAVVRLLIEHGAQVDAQTRTGAVPAFRTPASNSGSKGAGIVRGGWPERGERDPTPGAKTPLLYAAREGHLDTVALLLGSGAQLEQADADGVAPLTVVR